jgi:hypothetical protein
MKLRAEKELQGPAGRPQEKAGQKRASAMLITAFAAAAVLAEGCTPCPVADSCNTNDYDITLGEGETKDTMSNGVPMHITAMSISVNARVEGAICRAYSGGAHVKLRIDSDPPYEQEFDISPSMCFSVVERCIGVNDTEVTSDVRLVTSNGLYDGDAGTGVYTGGDGGTLTESCEITNKKVSFTLTIGE